MGKGYAKRLRGKMSSHEFFVQLARQIVALDASVSLSEHSGR